MLLLIHHHALPLLRLFIQQRIDTDPTSFGTEMTTQSICTSESPTTSPLATPGEVTATDEFLFTGMQPLVPLPIMLSRKGFPADSTYERPFIGVRTQMGS